MVLFSRVSLTGINAYPIKEKVELILNTSAVFRISYIINTPGFDSILHYLQ